jgi:hypothetical protein
MVIKRSQNSYSWHKFALEFSRSSFFKADQDNDSGFRRTFVALLLCHAEKIPKVTLT